MLHHLGSARRWALERQSAPVTAQPDSPDSWSMSLDRRPSGYLDIDDDLMPQRRLRSDARGRPRRPTFASARTFGQQTAEATACCSGAPRPPERPDCKRTLAEAGIELLVFISGHDDVQMSVRAMKAGAVDFLAKPFRNQDLLDAVHQGIERDRARRTRDVKVAKLHERYRSLTERERDIMALVVLGHPNKQIAAELALAEVT